MTITQAAWPDLRLRRGLSIVELMVGITIGLFILAGASMVLTTQLGDNRRLLLEAQLQQDLRSTTDMISREIRSAGYWGNAYKKVWNKTPTNPYSEKALVATANDTSLEYYRSRGEDIGVEENDTLNDNEYGGFRLTGGAIEVQLGINNWQQLTDPAVLTVTQFTLVPNTVALTIPASVPDGGTLRLCTQDVTLTIVVKAVHDASVQRSISNRIRLRNDVVKASCT